MKGVYLKKGNTRVSVVPYYRVGDLFLTTIATNPSNFLGGKWELFGPGRCLVCVNTSDNDFNTVKKTGGHKNLQSHTHTLNNHTHSFSSTTSNSGKHAHRLPMKLDDKVSPGNYDYLNYDGWGWASYYNWTQQDGEHSHTVSGTTDGNSGNTGSSGSGNSQNLQPYITCYVWIRTA